MKFIEKMHKHNHRVAESIFRVSAGFFCLLFVIEYLEPGFVANWFHPAWLLLIVIASGSIALQPYD